MTIDVSQDDTATFPWAVRTSDASGEHLITRGPSREWCVFFLFNNYLRFHRPPMRVSVVGDDVLLVEQTGFEPTLITYR